MVPPSKQRKPSLYPTDSAFREPVPEEEGSVGSDPGSPEEIMDRYDELVTQMLQESREGNANVGEMRATMAELAILRARKKKVALSLAMASASSPRPSTPRSNSTSGQQQQRQQQQQHRTRSSSAYRASSASSPARNRGGAPRPEDTTNRMRSPARTHMHSPETTAGAVYTKSTGHRHRHYHRSAEEMRALRRQGVPSSRRETTPYRSIRGSPPNQISLVRGEEREDVGHYDRHHRHHHRSHRRHGSPEKIKITSPEKRRLLGKEFEQTRALRQQVDLARLTSQGLRNNQASLSMELLNLKKKMSQRKEDLEGLFRRTGTTPTRGRLSPESNNNNTATTTTGRQQPPPAAAATPSYDDTTTSEITMELSDSHSNLRGNILTNLRLLQDAQERTLRRQQRQQEKEERRQGAPTTPRNSPPQNKNSSPESTSPSGQVLMEMLQAVLAQNDALQRESLQQQQQMQQQDGGTAEEYRRAFVAMMEDARRHAREAVDNN